MKNINDLRTILWEEIEAVRTNKRTSADARAINEMTRTILSSYGLQIKAAQLTNRQPVDNGFLQIEDKPKAA